MGLKPHANKLYMPAQKKPQTAPNFTKKNPYTVAMSKVVGAEVVAEHRFHDTRKWRFDYAIPHLRIALEVEGGVWTGGRHTSAKGFLRDMDKYNEAALNGWIVLRCTPKTLWSDGLRLLAEALKFRQANII